MTSVSKYTLITALIVCAGLLISAQKGDDEMAPSVARALKDVEFHEPFPDEIDAVEKAWNEPIPSNLIRIGGIDWWSWAYIEQTNIGGQLGFVGAYRDSRILYEGAFVYSHPKELAVPSNVFENYAMSHLDDTALVFIEIGDTPPLGSFVLVPANPENIRFK